MHKVSREISSERERGRWNAWVCSCMRFLHKHDKSVLFIDIKVGVDRILEYSYRYYFFKDSLYGINVKEIRAIKRYKHIVHYCINNY